jgi:hypothetical protein
MRVDKYKLRFEASATSFRFVSEGPKGNIRKLIIFQPTELSNVFNLAFGDEVGVAGDLDDVVVSGNGDSEKVLATVVSALYVFFEKYPNASILAVGSTSARNRLYRMGITKFFELIIQDFYLFGLVGEEFYDFKLDKSYSGYLVQRKFD